MVPPCARRRQAALYHDSVNSIYLDNNATTQPAPEVIDAVRRAMHDQWANPSSVHRAGQAVRREIELAREEVCRLINCQPRELVFTAGGTESTNLAIRSSLAPESGRRVLVTDRLEHAATRETAESLAAHGVESVWLPIEADGLVDVERAREVILARSSEIGLVSIQWVNNETGAVQPVCEIGEICRAANVRLHVDGVQWVGRMPTDLSTLPVDLLSISAHKFHGPKGIGALFIRRGVRLSAQITGGPQERERRGGTENTPGILGMGVASRLAREWLDSQPTEVASAGHIVGGRSIPVLRAMRERFERRIREQHLDAHVNQGDVERLWSTSNIAFPGLEAEAILLLLSERGVYASAGAACSSGALDPSPVLLALGIPPVLAHGSVRFSFSRMTTDAEADQATEIISRVIDRLRPLSPSRGSATPTS